MRLPRYLRWPLAALLVVHGSLHVLGFLWAFDLARIDEFDRPTLLIPGREAGDPVTLMFGLLWFIAMVALIGAGVGVARERTWSRSRIGIAAGISLVPSVAWWNDSWGAAMLSAVILLSVAFTPSRDRKAGPIHRSPGRRQRATP